MTRRPRIPVLHRGRMLADLERHPCVIVSWVDRDGVIIQQVGRGLDGVDLPEGRSDWLGYPLDRGGGAHRALERVLRGESEVAYTMPWTSPGGQRSRWAGVATPWFDGAGRISGAVMVALRMDIDEPEGPDA